MKFRAMFIGKVISHYRVLESIGRGGMGEVFLAEDTILSRRVALKFLTTGENAVERDKILGEARSAASIDHPYVCKVFETGDFEGKPFIVMEYVDGHTLEHRLKSGPIPLPEALPIVIEISEALAEAHGKGTVHCDLKPANVMIARSGHVKLMDFGLARPGQRRILDSDDETLLMSAPSVAGTPAYMAPEQARGESLDARADIFAIGIMFFEMLSGVHPFRKSTRQATLGAILYEDAPDIGRYLAAAPPSLLPIFSRLLAKNPEARYSSAGELASDLVALRDKGTSQGFAPALPTIAILPFQDLSPQRDQEYFCDGLAEELIVALGGIEGLRVVSRSAAFQFRNTAIGLNEIGKALRATMILEGSVRKAGERLRIVVNLVDLDNGCPVWSERYDRQLHDIFEVQDEIARGIADKLRVTFKLEPVDLSTDAGTQNIGAYELYLKGRHLWNKRTEENLRLSIDLFEQAIAEDPEYALAWAGIADARVTLSLYGAVRPIDTMPLARNAVDRALALRPELPQALMTRACIRAIFDWDWPEAERDFETAIRLNPRSSQAHQWLAINCLAPRGLFERANKELKLASEFEPLSLAIVTSLGILDFFGGDCDAAIRRFRAVLELEGGFYLARYFLGQVYSQEQMHAEAIRELEQAVALSNASSESLAALGYAQAAAGHHAEALQTLRQLLQRETNAYVSPVSIAQVQVGLHQIDAAMDNLEKALRIHATDLIWLKVRPAFASVRSQERVSKIMIEAGLVTKPAAQSAQASP